MPGIGEAPLAMLRAPGVSLVEEALPALINELADVSEQFVLVLDDYHAIEDERIHERMARSPCRNPGNRPLYPRI
jgi:ATP/maltotriose-dependent transcriptional regulator MalT